MATIISTIREKRELVDRVANSPTFLKSPRLREFLIYVADCTISDRLEDAREQQIAVNVFDRKADYNPGLDNIVRVEARGLRKRLEAHFAADGKDEPIVISVPKGSYSISFETRPQAYPSPPIEISYPANTTAPPLPGSQWLLVAPWLIIVALAVIIAMQWQFKRPEKGLLKPAPAPTLPFSVLIQPAKDTYIVTSDSSLVLIEELRRKQIGLEDYITGRYIYDTGSPDSDPVRQEMIRILLTRRYTNAAETAIAGRIIQRNNTGPQRIVLRSSRGVQLTDFKNHNVILFGSPTSNPWARLFSEKLNFQFEWDQARRGLFRNQSPRPGEQSVYSMATNPGESGEAYAVVALVPNVNSEGHVLLIDGTTAEGTEAAGEFITDQERTVAVLKAMGIDPGGPPRYFEILLKAKAIAGSASQSTILSSRLISDR